MLISKSEKRNNHYRFMTQLSVNVNKVATLRNARGGAVPDVLKVALDCERFGAQGITVHPRPDERHIRYADVYALRPALHTEFNIEGNPIGKFIDLVLQVKPAQVTMVPDFLSETVDRFIQAGIRTSIFVDADLEMIEWAAKTGTDRVELYTEPYASGYATDREKAVAPFVEAAKLAHKLGMGVNAGHDLSLENLRYFHEQVPYIDEVSIGHALICDALYLGLEETIRRYLDCLK